MSETTGKTNIGRIVLLIAVAFLLFGLLSGLRASSGLLISSLSEWTGMSYGTVSIAFSVMNIVLAVSGPFFGLLTLKIPPAKIMIAGAVLGGAGFLGTAFCTSLPALILCVGILFGLGASAIVSDVIPIEKFAAVFSLLYTFIILAYAVMSSLGGIVYDLFGNFDLVDGITAVFAAGTAILFTISGLKQRKTVKEK